MPAKIVKTFAWNADAEALLGGVFRRATRRGVTLRSNSEALRWAMQQATRRTIMNLDAIILRSGAHSTRKQGMCAMEAAAWLAKEKHSDHPACVSGVIGAFVRSWNDNLSTDEDRTRLLRPLLPEILATASGDLDVRRSWMAVDFAVRIYAPAWLDLAGCAGASAEMRACVEIVDMVTADASRGARERGRTDGAAAWAAARDAAGAAARDAAGAAARDAAGDAAWAAAWAAAGAAAGAAARDAAGDAARDAAGDAAWAAAWAAAGDAAWAAAWAAAGDAARDAAWAAAWAAAGSRLAPTVTRLQREAQGLILRMAALSHPVRSLDEIVPLAT